MAEYALEVREHIMIAHSLPRPIFGPAQEVHGATFIVDAAFFRDSLDADNLVVDIGAAHSLLKQVLASLNYKNLDDAPELEGKITTTEFLCKYIFDQLAEKIGKGVLGPSNGGLRRLRVTLHESHVARAWYEGALA